MSCHLTRRIVITSVVSAVLLVPLSLAGCASDEQPERDFFTSGSRQADQRAEQHVAKVEQLRDENDEKGAETAEQRSLYERLGGEEGLQAIVDDFVARALADPRVNWERKGIRQGGLSLDRWDSAEWKPSPQDVAQLKKHMVQFLSLSTGGPSHYDGQDMAQAHSGMHITNAEFDAAVGDLQATLDKLQIATGEQKELLAIIESTRPQVVGER